MKRAQIHFTESIFVLLILIIIIFIGIVITFVFFNRYLTEKEETIQQTDTITLTDSIIRMPEFTCGKADNCIDDQKVFAFGQLYENTFSQEEKAYYERFFKNRRITLHIIYPEVTIQDAKCVPEPTIIKDPNTPYPLNCGWFLLYGQEEEPENALIAENPVQLYFPLLNKKALGILRIEVIQ